MKTLRSRKKALLKRTKVYKMQWSKTKRNLSRHPKRYSNYEIPTPNLKNNLGRDKNNQQINSKQKKKLWDNLMNTKRGINQLHS